MVSIGTSGSLDDARSFTDQTGLSSGTVVFDDAFRIWRHYGVTGTPTAILFDAAGNQIHEFGGRFNGQAVLDRI